MNQEKKEAIDAITFHLGLKVVMKFSEKFYPDVINWNVENGEKTFYDVAFKKEVQSNILGFLCKGDESKKYYALNSEAAIISSLLEELDKMFDGKATATYSGDYIMENWGQHEFTQGTWTEAFQEKKAHMNVLNQSLDNKVYFAGELNDPYRQMGVPGAVLSGYYSIDQLLTDN